MEFTHCFGCMEDTADYPCKKCGFDPATYVHQPYVLRLGIILHGRYVIGQVLGQGGFGITYVGWDLAMDSKVAIKEYFPAGQVMRNSQVSHDLQWFTTDQAKWSQTDGLEKFLKEARKMSKVSGIPEVVQIRSLFQENGTAYIVMDFVSGVTLKQYLDSNKVLSWNKAKSIFLPAIQAMDKIHKFGLIHRDISPDNLMIQSDGQLKILDLGAAKDLSVNSGVSSMQVAKTGFSPLEQYQAGGSGPWTDVYSMAATMYYSITGVVPPAAMDRMEKDTIRWDLPQFQALPTSVRAALIRALAVLPKNRIQSMEDFLRQLDAPPVPKPVPTPDPGKRKRNKPLIIGICAAVCALVLMITVPLLKKEDGGSKISVSHVHTWVEATCTDPKTCSGCGETSGVALGHIWEGGSCTQGKTCTRCGESDGQPTGHQWTAATCTDPKTCSVCGETEGSALGHDWKDATYDAPKTCSRCGKTSGDPLGYLSDVDGSFESFSWGNSNTHKYVFDQPVYGCTDFVLYYEPTFNSGCYVSNWRVLVQDTAGTWHSDYSFTLNETDYTHTITLKSKMNIKAVAVTPMVSGSYSYSFSLGVWDVHYKG